MQVPYKYDRTNSANELRQKYENQIEAGETTDSVVSVAGRLMLRRGQGKIAFGQLQDSSGSIQLFAANDVTQQFSEFTELKLGDWIGVKGVVLKTKKGELSVRVENWELLAKALATFPDKYHGLSDPDLRYRQRYVDFWVTPGARDKIILRSKMTSLIRRWLEDRDFIEVETPILQSIPGGADALPFITHHNALDMDMYLRIATELHLKRLVVGGIEKVFEIGRLFRNEGISVRHNPEFTSLEWYEAYTDCEGVMKRAEELIEHIALTLLGTTVVEVDGESVDLKTPWRRATMAELIEEQTGVKPDLSRPDEIRQLAQKHLDKIEPGWGPGKLMLEVYEKTAEAKQKDPVFVIEYPKEVSPLARNHRTIDGMTDRFEAIVFGREICNGFSELIDPDEQRLRFEDQARKRVQGDDEAMRMDDDYVKALEYGLPPTGGIGIGIDRLAMLITGSYNIKDVLAFPLLREVTASQD